MAKLTGNAWVVARWLENEGVPAECHCEDDERCMYCAHLRANDGLVAEATQLRAVATIAKQYVAWTKGDGISPKSGVELYNDLCDAVAPVTIPPQGEDQ